MIMEMATPKAPLAITLFLILVSSILVNAVNSQKEQIKVKLELPSF